MNGKKYYFLLLIMIIFCSCRKFLTIAPPKNQITATTVFSNDASAIAAVRGIYSLMMSDNNFCSGGLNSATLLCGYSADDFIYYGNAPDRIQFYSVSLTSTNATLKTAFWQASYQYINNANTIIESLQNNTQVTTATSNELTGEAKFIRAFCHFYLVNLFGDIPYITSTDYSVNALAFRNPVSDVYQKIETDLTDAMNLLGSDYSFSNGERDQPNRWAAAALLARVYLFNKQWSNAATEAAAVIASNQFALLLDPNSVFLKNSTEAIWQLKPVIPSINTNEGNYFILTTAPAEVSLSNQLVNSFDSGDLRKADWINNITVGSTTYFYPFKYKVKSATPLSEYSMVLRLAEQYLILAEAETQQNDLTDAIMNINLIRKRAGLAPLANSLSQTNLLAAIDKERRFEFFAEWGHRWLDLKRRQETDAILAPVKGNIWQSTDALYPIPQSEIINDNNLNQNPGY
jgi:hypothetical protein